MVAWPLQVSSFTAPPSTGCYFFDDPFDCTPRYNIALLTTPCLVLLISPKATTVCSRIASIPFHVFSDCMHQWFRKCLSPAGRRSPSSETISRAITAIKSHITSHHCYQVTHNKPSQLSSHTKQGIMPIKLHIRRYHGYQFTYQRVFKQSLQILHLGYLARLYYHIWLKRCHWLSKQFRVSVSIRLC